jgi:hypothetical protein
LYIIRLTFAFQILPFRGKLWRLETAANCYTLFEIPNSVHALSSRIVRSIFCPVMLRCHRELWCCLLMSKTNLSNDILSKTKWSDDLLSKTKWSHDILSKTKLSNDILSKSKLYIHTYIELTNCRKDAEMTYCRCHKMSTWQIYPFGLLFFISTCPIR